MHFCATCFSFFCLFLRLGSRHILFLCLTCGLCNILLIPVTLNLANTHTHIEGKRERNTRQVLQIRTEHEPNWEHENQPKIPAVGLVERERETDDGERGSREQQQPYVDDNMHRHVYTHTRTQINTNANANTCTCTPCRSSKDRACHLTPLNGSLAVICYACVSVCVCLQSI